MIQAQKRCSSSGAAFGVVAGWLGVSGVDTGGPRMPSIGSRYLSNSGRLFFDSADALVPQDVNGKEDVYEYEPPGEGSCTESVRPSANAPVAVSG